MTAVLERVTQPVTVDLAGGHAGAHCLTMATEMHRLLEPRYARGASVMPLGGTFEHWQGCHRTARKRAARALRLGYRFAEIDRPGYEHDVHTVNTSTPERQGRPMSAGYRQQPVFSPIPQLCDRHHIYTYAVLDREETLVAYLWLYRCGDLAMVSSILGHHDRLRDDIMYLLAAGTIAEQTPLGGTLFYNLHSSGTDGLRWFKERIGLAQENVEWVL